MVQQEKNMMPSNATSQISKRKRFDLRRLVADIAIELREILEARRLYGDISISKDTPRYLMSDPYLLKNIFLALVNHSLRFLKSGGITIRIFTDSYATDKQKHIHLTITDTSLGFLPEEIDDIFRPHVQHRPATDKNYIMPDLFRARELARSIGGDVSVQNVFGWGTMYSFSIAAQEATMPFDNISN